jgi:hypothetical protein
VTSNSKRRPWPAELVPPWAEPTRAGISYTLSVALEAEGIKFRAINISESFDPPSVRVRVLLPWWSWPIAWLTGRRAKIRELSADFAEMCRPAGIEMKVTAGWI